MTMLVNLLAFVFVLGVLVILHELGHFLMARLLGAPVEVFSVGFGRRLWGIRRGGTDYRVSLIPFGGYVRILGLGPDESDIAGSNEAAEVELLPRWKRALILFAGPVTNLIAAIVFVAAAFVAGVAVPAYQDQPAVVGWVEPDSPAAATDLRAGDRIVAVDSTATSTWRDLETLMLTSGGHEVSLRVRRGDTTATIPLTPRRVTRYQFGYSGLLPPLDATVQQVSPNSPAQLAGIAPGDRITSVNGEPVSQFYDLIRLISPNPGKPVSITVDRGGATVQLEVTPRDESGEGKIGIPLVFPTQMRQLAPVAAIGAGATESWRMTIETFRVIGKLLTRKATLRQVSGPIDIARISGDAARSGFRSLVWLMGLISLQLGIFNLLPIPILDGGHLAIIGFESAIRRDLSIKVKERILEVGFVLLILLMVVVLFNDVVKILPESVYKAIYGGS